MTTSTTSLADRVLDAYEASTFDLAVFTPDATGRHNFDAEGADLSIAVGMETMQAIRAVIPDLRFADRCTYRDPGGTAIAQYMIRGTLPEGSALAIPGCMVMRADGDRVAHVLEYLDPAALAPIIAAIESAADVSGGTR